MATITYSVGENDDIYLNVYEGVEKIVSEPASYPFINASTGDLTQCLSAYKQSINTQAQRLIECSEFEKLNSIIMEIHTTVYKHDDLLSVLLEREDYNP